MNKLIVPAVIVATGMVAAAAESEIVRGAIFHVILHASFAFEVRAIA